MSKKRSMRQQLRDKRFNESQHRFKTARKHRQKYQKLTKQRANNWKHSELFSLESSMEALGYNFETVN